MSKHTVTFTIELDDSGDGDPSAVLIDLVSNALVGAREDWQADNSDSCEAPMRYDGYSGPFLTAIDARIDGQAFNC